MPFPKTEQPVWKRFLQVLIWSGRGGKTVCQSVCLKIASEITGLAHFFTGKGYKHNFSEKAIKKTGLL